MSTQTNLKRLQQKHHRLIRLAMDGKSGREIANELDCTPQTVYNVLSSPVVKAEIARKQEKADAETSKLQEVRSLSAKQVLGEASVAAAQTQVELLSSANEKVRQLSAMDILDRTGFPKITRTDQRHVSAHIVLSEEAVKRLQETTQLCFDQDFNFTGDQQDEPEDNPTSEGHEELERTEMRPVQCAM